MCVPRRFERSGKVSNVLNVNPQLVNHKIYTTTLRTGRGRRSYACARIVRKITEIYQTTHTGHHYIGQLRGRRLKITRRNISKRRLSGFD